MPIDVGTIAAPQWARGAANAGHAVTLTVSQPDGITLTPAPTVTDMTSSGTYTADILTTQPGRYVLRWDDAADGLSYVDTMEVWPADPRLLISLDDAARSLKWPAAEIAKNGDMLRLYIAAATDVLEDITGALLVRTVVQQADGGRTGVLLWERPTGDPVVTIDGKAYTRAKVNRNAGIVYADGIGGRFPDGVQNITITYLTGSESVSPSIQLAARELVRHLWQVGQQALTGNAVESTQQDPRQMGFTKSGFAVPNRVIELAGNQHALPGIA